MRSTTPHLKIPCPAIGTAFAPACANRGSILILGINFNLGYECESAANLTGGRRVGVRYTDQWTASTNLNLEKLVGLSAAAFQFTVTDRNGRNLSSDLRLGTLQIVQ